MEAYIPTNTRTTYSEAYKDSLISILSVYIEVDTKVSIKKIYFTLHFLILSFFFLFQVFIQINITYYGIRMIFAVPGNDNKISQFSKNETWDMENILAIIHYTN